MKGKKKKKEELINELEELRARVAELEEDFIDDLTGLHNLRNFFVLAEHEFARAHRYERPLAFVMLSVDNLNKIIENYDESVVDEVLATVAERFRTSVRYVDILGRYGEDTFVLMLPEADLTNSRKVADRIRNAITGAPIETEDGPINITISIGVSNLTVNTPNLIVMIERADMAMNVAKREGGGRIEIG